MCDGKGRALGWDEVNAGKFNYQFYLLVQTEYSRGKLETSRCGHPCIKSLNPSTADGDA